MGSTWGPSGADRTHVGPMLVPWTLPSGDWIYPIPAPILLMSNFSHKYIDSLTVYTIVQDQAHWCVSGKLEGISVPYVKAPVHNRIEICYLTWYVMYTGIMIHLWHTEARWRIYTSENWVLIVSNNTCCIFGQRPFPESKLRCSQFYPSQYSSLKFVSKYKNLYLQKRIAKYHQDTLFRTQSDKGHNEWL